MNREMLGSSAKSPIMLWDRSDIMKYLESQYGDEFFVNGESVIKTNEGVDCKLIQLKLDSGEYKNIYFGLL